MPDSRNAAATAAETSSSSVGRIRAALEELNFRTERIEHRRDLRSGGATANHDDGLRHRAKTPGIAVSRRQFAPGTESSAGAAWAKDNLVGLQCQTARSHDRVRIHEPSHACMLMNLNPR